MIKHANSSTLSLFVFSILLCSCSTFDRTLELVGLGPENQLSKITIESTRGSNSQSPVSTDFIFIFDDSLAPLLTNLTAREWFQNKAAFKLQYSDRMKVVSRELVPASSSMSVNLPDKSKGAIAIIFFANYIAKEGQIATRLEGYQDVNIKLNEHKYFITRN